MLLQSSPAHALHKLVQTMDKAADLILQEHYDISYRRAYFLFTLQHLGTTTQHNLALSLGYSDASVSTMLAELQKTKLVSVQQSPEHKRKQLVSLTQHGDHLVTEGQKLLDAKFAEVMAVAEVDPQEYAVLTEKLYEALTSKPKEKTS
jgi:DNA-binding MarR family transcriptional regulator